MPVTQLVLLLVVLGGLMLFTTQNWSSVLALTVLGTKTLELPVAVWVLAAATAGFLTSYCLQLLNRLQPSPGRTPIREPETPRTSRRRKPEQDYTRTQESRYADPPQEETNSAEADEASDWDEPPRAVDEWDDWEEEERTAERPANTQFQQDTTNFEAKQEPKTVSRTGSTYSFSYREPRNSGVGKTEDVYDAEYRVITPPYREAESAYRDAESAESDEQKEDEWGLTDDEYLEDDEPGHRPRS